MPDQPHDATIERRRAPRQPEDDQLTGRLDTLERRVRDAAKDGDRDVEDRLSRRLQTIEERIVQVETTAVNGHSLLLQRVADVQTTVTKLDQATTDFMTFMQGINQQQQAESQAKHDQAIADAARADLLAKQDQERKDREAARVGGLRMRNRYLAGASVACWTTMAGVAVWLLTSFERISEIEATIGFAALASLVVLSVLLAASYDTAAGI